MFFKKDPMKAALKASEALHSIPMDVMEAMLDNLFKHQYSPWGDKFPMWEACAAHAKVKGDEPEKVLRANPIFVETIAQALYGFLSPPILQLYKLDANMISEGTPAQQKALVVYYDEVTLLARIAAAHFWVKNKSLT